MSDYSFIIEDMEWSFSRLNSFYDCPHGWLNRYIFENEGDNNFFSEFGSFAHLLLEKYFKNEFCLFELSSAYEEDFYNNVKCSAPYNKYADIGLNYYNAGKEYFDNFDGLPQFKPLEIEQKHKFTIGDYKFRGVIDLAATNENDDIELIDNKSAGLKPRSKRKKETKDDLKLKKYLRQLYLYSIPIFNKYGKYPKYLNFNCFRKDLWIREEFNVVDFEEAKQWALDTIQLIKKEQDWKPLSDWYYCNNLCNFRNNYCEYKVNNR